MNSDITEIEKETVKMKLLNLLKTHRKVSNDVLVTLIMEVIDDNN